MKGVEVYDFPISCQGTNAQSRIRTYDLVIKSHALYR